MALTPVPRKLWQHSDPASTSMGRFQRTLEEKTGCKFNSFYDLYLYSVNNRSVFWDCCWRYLEIIHEGFYAKVVDEQARMDSVPEWFCGVRLNFAENLLFSRFAGDKTGKEDSKIAVTEVREGEIDRPINLSWGELRRRVGVLIQAMRANGVHRGDRIAVCAANSIDTLLIFLASAALGAIFTSMSSDLGLKGILDRILQTKPRWLFMDDWAVYNGKVIDLRAKMASITQGMLSIPEFKGVVSLPRFTSQPADVSQVPNACLLASYVEKAGPSKNALEFERVDFRDPCVIVYSSGTTGPPKCIVHSVGGVLLNGRKEGELHMELGAESVALQYTTTAWIMYLLGVQALMFGSRVILYDGSPFFPDATALVRLAAQERVTHLGISPRWLHELQRANIRPRELANLSSLQVVSSTGSVLRDELFEWFYDVAFPPRTRLNNIAGGTDIAGCFGISNPLAPVYVGGCAGYSLGVPVGVYDSAVEGAEGVQKVPVEEGAPGELVATAAFPNLPTHFWGDDRGKKYHDAYFARFDNVWNHGDFVSICPRTKQLLFHGRADGVLNPSGVRFGSSEIYRVIEAEFTGEIADSLCVGQRRPTDADERVMLFLLMKPGSPLTLSLISRVKSAIREHLSPRHVPMFIFETPEIPTTVNLKKVELPVKHIVSGKRVEPSGTLLNPRSLEFYYRFAEVETLFRESKL
ncbi:AMP-dependent synthetase/ligase [Penicillium sp. IBT 31633x]|nr:AMP-dependent synthetase/ligase [Penicillium sp. IBT 31633x]